MWVAIWECQRWLAQWGTGSWVRPLGTTIIQAAQVIPGLPPHLSSLWWAHKGTGGIQGPGLIPLCYFLQHLKVPVVFTISSFLNLFPFQLSPDIIAQHGGGPAEGCDSMVWRGLYFTGLLAEGWEVLDDTNPKGPSDNMRQQLEG